MYIVINKKNKEVIHINTSNLSKNLSDTEVYENFSAGTMEIIKTDELIPANFKIGQNNEILEMPWLEQVGLGILSIESALEQHLDNSDYCKSKINELVNNNLFKTIEQCKKALEIINNIIERKVAQEYNKSYEMKITKDYMGWIEDNKPDNDPRQIKYQNMQNYINSVKMEFSDIKETLKSLISELEKSQI
ncbi:hypothetical protein ACE1AT_24575 [Pelatocladus sp. BLCC-F211]|uniref:hypothetical protein n=1 Tax=Pelatocladus sp. BLCC-F211 TaxID=3342752 RepID=UPI0035BB42CF